MKKEIVKIQIKNETRLLPVKLNAEEIRNAGNELARTVQEISNEEERQKNIKDQLKARISELESRQSNLALKISRGEEYRDVNVTVEMNVEGQVIEIRTDTGEILVTREATAIEKQLSLKEKTEE